VAKTLRRLRVDEISSVDRGAGDGVHVVLMKRSDELYDLSKADDLPDEVVAYLKRVFTAEQRREAASSGAAMKDGSYPIENKEDLHNAVRAIGRGKAPHAEIRRHIISRARALGLTAELPDDWKVGKGLFAKAMSLLGWSEPTLADQIAASGEALRKSVMTIIADASLDATAKSEAVRKTFDEYAEHLDGTIPAGIAEALAEAGITITKEGHMAETEAERKARVEREEREKRRAARKARGMSDAEEEDEEKRHQAGGQEPEQQEDAAIRELQDAQRREREAGEKRKSLVKALVAKMSDKHKEFHDKLDGDEAKERFAAMSAEERDNAMREHDKNNAGGEEARKLAKAETELADMRKRVARLEDDKALVGFQKRAVEMGLTEAAGATLMKAERGDVEAVRALTKMLGEATAAAREAGIFKEFGTRVEGAGGTAMDQLLAKAEELRKAEPKLTREQAFEKVYSDPDNVRLVALHKREAARVSDAD
jgi:hypothetical protein